MPPHVLLMPPNMGARILDLKQDEPWKIRGLPIHCQLIFCILSFLALGMFCLFVAWDGTDPGSKTAWNDKLVLELEDFQQRNLRFVAIFHYKENVHFTLKNGMETPFFPDVLGLVHHEGIVLQCASVDISSADGQTMSYLKLEFSSQGLAYHIHGNFPAMPHLIPYSADEQFHHGSIDGELGEPRSLVKLLNQLRDRRYDMFRFSCWTFAHVVWDYYMATEDQASPFV